MKRTIMYRYATETQGCGCCTESHSAFEIWEDGILMNDYIECPVFENEEDLRRILKHLEPFDVDPDSWWF